MKGELKTFRTNSQTAKILKHLQEGNTLTVLEASILGFGMNLRSRVSDLKNAGYDIKSEQVNFNGGYVAKYSLNIKED